MPICWTPRRPTATARPKSSRPSGWRTCWTSNRSSRPNWSRRPTLAAICPTPEKLFSIREKLYEPVLWAEELGIELLLEPHGELTDTVDGMAAILDALGHDATVGVNLDTGNSWLGGGDPLNSSRFLGGGSSACTGRTCPPSGSPSAGRGSAAAWGRSRWATEWSASSRWSPSCKRSASMDRRRWKSPGGQRREIRRAFAAVESNSHRCAPVPAQPIGFSIHWR